MKRLAVAGAVLAAGLAVATPASAGHDVHWRRHDVATGGYVTVGGGGHVYYSKPGVTFSLGFGYPAPYAYGYAPAPVYVAPPPVYAAPHPVYYAPVRYYHGLPLVVAPSSCGAHAGAHYVRRGGHYHRHKGHQHHHRGR